MDRFKALLDSKVAAGLFAVNELGYYYAVSVPKSKSQDLVLALWQVFESARDVEASGVAVTTTDRFGRPMWRPE
jgi:hypothetical protein